MIVQKSAFHPDIFFYTFAKTELIMTHESTEFRVKGEDLLKRIKQLVHEGNIRRIIIKDEQGNTFMEIPLTVGIVGTAVVPVWAAIGALAALVSNFTIEVIKVKEEPENSGDENAEK
jgi:hypothetical protein